MITVTLKLPQSLLKREESPIPKVTFGTRRGNPPSNQSNLDPTTDAGLPARFTLIAANFLKFQ